MENIDNFILADQLIKPFVKKTNLDFYKDNIYLKRESNQITNSFKWKGVLYSVLNIFEKIMKNEIKNDFYLITQSTGNHGIASLKAIYIVKEYYKNKFPNKINSMNNIHPGIFTNKKISKKKLVKMKKELLLFGKETKGFIDISTDNYGKSLISRTEFLKRFDGIYLEHGGKDIMTGYGSIGIEIDKQVPKNKDIAIFLTVGAGGPIGIGACLKLLRKTTKVIICQSNDYDAFIRTLKTNELKHNNENNEVGFSEGIAVNCPELFAVKIAKKIVDDTFIVKNNQIKLINDQTKLGGSTCIALFTALNYNLNDNYVKIVLDCEGNN